MNKQIEEIKKEYYLEVDKLSDDTGYFDHEFVLGFFLPKISNLITKSNEEAIEKISGMGFVKENSDITQEYQSVFLDGYNQAIEEVVEYLTQKEEE